MGARRSGSSRARPERVVSLTYSGTNGGATNDEARERKAELEREGYYEGSLLRRALAEEFYERSPDMAFLYRQIRSINPPRPRDFLAPNPPRLTRLNRRGTTAGRLSESGIPILWLVGANDRIVAPELIEVSHRMTPGSRFEAIEDAGHSSYFERPDAWNDTVLGFIDGVEAAGGSSPD